MKNKDTPKIDNTLDTIKETKAKQKRKQIRAEEDAKGEELDKAYRGRPLKFQSVEELEQRIEEYKQYLVDEKKPPTMAGLAYYLDIDRHTLFNYGKKEQFSTTIKKAVEWVTLQMEEKCADKANAGIIFLMKNYGYTDRETNSVTVNVSLETQLKDMQGDEF